MKSFIVVSIPNYQDYNRKEEWLKFFPDYNKNSFRTRLLDGNNTLEEAVKTLINNNKDDQNGLEFPLRLTHPKSINSSTVCIWKHKREDSIFYVKDQGDLDAFDRPNTNLLYLPTLQGKELIDFCDTKNYNQKYRYKVIKPQNEILGFSNSLASQISDVHGVFFQQVKEGEGINPTIKDIEYNPDISENEDEYCIAGWLNPLIFILSLDGNEIESIQASNEDEYLNALSLFLEPSSLLLVGPHINESYDLRISLLIKLYEKIKERERKNLSSDRCFSLMEYLLFYSHNPQTWKPFLILDLLAGKFYAKQNVSTNNNNQSEQRQKFTIDWELPENASSNMCWFANYWLKQWISNESINEERDVNVIPQPIQARSHRSSGGLTTFQVDNLSKNTSLTSILSQHPAFFSDTEKMNLYGFLVELFEDNSVLEKCLAQFPHQNFWWTENFNNGLIKFDEVAFWNYFSKFHFIPESPILIQIPQQKNRFLNPIASLNSGAYHFLWAFFEAVDGDRQLKDREFYNSFGWWNDWHSTIFCDRYDIELEFISRRGFVINQSLLGQDYLGEKGRRIDWEEPNMRFSRS